MNCMVDCPELRIYRPLIPVTVSLATGIAAGAWLPGHFGWVLVAVLIIFTVLWCCVLRRCWALVFPLLACLCGGYLSIQSWLAPQFLPEHHISHYVDKGYWQIYGVVSQSPEIRHGRWRFELSARRIVNKLDTIDVCGRVWVTGRGEWPGAKIGDSVVFRGRLRSIRNFSNPGGFDYKRFMMLNGLRARVYSSANSFKIASVDPSMDMHQRTERLRKSLALQMDVALHAHSPDTVALLKALLLGDRSGISVPLRADYNRAGVGHVLAISGLHVGMVATVSFALARWILAFIPLLLELAWVRKAAALVSLVPVLGYGLLAGLSPSTQRAMLMVAVFLLGIWVGRRHDWLNTLAFAALIILTVFPPALLSISFQLSFSAVLAIIAGSHLMLRVDTKPEAVLWKKTAHRIMAFLWVSALAILGTMPLVLSYFNQVSLVGLATNLLVVPLVGFVVVPAGLLGTLGTMVDLELGAFLWHIAAWGAQWMLWIVQFASSRSWAAVQCVTPNGLEICLYYLLGALLLYWKKLPHWKTLALVVVFIIGVSDAGYWVYQRHGRRDLRVTAIDVGQASANLLELPYGYTILVDGGGYSDNKMFDVGAAVIAPFLWRKKIKTIDLVVLSHPNSDHLNGLLYILENFNVREAWNNHEATTTKGYQLWAELLADHKVTHVNFDQMSRSVIRNGVHLNILAPPADFMEQKNSAASWRDINNNSLVLRARYGHISFLFSGDIEAPAEAELVARVGAQVLDSTVLLVPHHGSRGSSTMDFLKAVRPEEAIISAGWQNRYKFPHAQVIERLQFQGSRIWCTAEAGAVEVTTDGTDYKIRTYRPNSVQD